MTVRHPGRILREDFMVPLQMSVAHLADLAGVSQQRVYQLLQQKRSITPDTATRLGQVSRMKPKHWLAMQAAWDLDQLDPPADARSADLQGFVTGPHGVLPLPARKPRAPVDMTFSREMAQAVRQAAALLAPVKAPR
ncbi:MAG: HigA family addiction module antitoxin [Myxococcota bacterium]